MTLEWQLIEPDSNLKFNKHDYLYFHNKETSPLQKEVSLETMFLLRK